MKEFYSLIFVIVFNACQSQYKDETIGLYVDFKGLEAENVKAFIQHVPKTDKTIRFGQELNVEVSGIADFTPIGEGYVLPNAEYAVSDKDGNLVFVQSDQFKKYGDKGVTQSDAENIKFNLTIGKPLEPNKTYYFLFRIWDQRSDKELKGNIELNVL